MVSFRANSIKTVEGVSGDLLVMIAAPLPVAEKLNNLSGEYVVEIKKYRPKRSLNANALFWKVCGSMAQVLGIGEEEMYLQLLQDYGVKKFIVVRPEAVESVKGLFRAVDEMGSVYVNGSKGIQLRCTIGSSQYNTAEMARLIKGAVYEAEQIGAWVPDEQDIGASLDLWNKERRTI